MIMVTVMGMGQRSPLMGLKAIDFLSVIDFISQSHPCTGQERQVFPERPARFDNCRVENFAPRTVSSSEEDKSQSRLASRDPHAVLSSPSNDTVIGKKNKKLMEKKPASRITRMSPHPPGNAAHQKAAAKPSSYCSPKNAKISRETASEKITPSKKSQGVCDIRRKPKNASPC